MTLWADAELLDATIRRRAALALDPTIEGDGSTDLLARAELDPVEGWEHWLAALFPDFCTAPFAEHHRQMWRWVWQIQPGVRPPVFIGVWNRGGAKSTSAEMATVALGARGKRKYALYVSGVQEKADDHVSTIATMLESSAIASHYPQLAERAVTKYGSSRGWRRNRLRTASGFIVDALGLDVDVRGVKLDEQRPDLIIIDDIDSEQDSAKIVRRKLNTISKALVPAGSDDLATVAIQNLIHENSVFARLLDGRAELFQRRQVSGPVAAIDGCKLAVIDGAWQIVAGTATWEGLPLARCQEILDDIGAVAFNAEYLHKVADRSGALWSARQLTAQRRPTPELLRVAIGLDPSGGSGDLNDEQGVVALGLGDDGHGYLIGDRSGHYAPEKWGKLAVLWALELGAEIVVEVNYGGDMCISVLKTEAKKEGIGGIVLDGKTNERLSDRGWRSDGNGSITIVRIVASRGKRQRAEPVAALYGDPQDEQTWEMAVVHHPAPADLLESEMVMWNPDSGDSPNRMDALVWAATRLFIDTGRKRGGLRMRDD